jgi:hypothetical protein
MATAIQQQKINTQIHDPGMHRQTRKPFQKKIPQ